MRLQKSQKLFVVQVLLESGNVKGVYVKAATKEAAERRALKRTPSAVEVYQSQER